MALTINTKIQNDADNYSLDAKQVKGGYGVVAVAADLPNLPAATIVEGSLYYVQETDKFYIYNDSTWNEAEFGGGNVTDVKINGKSIVTDKVAEIPKASASDLGAVKINSQNGINIDNSGTLVIWEASNNEIAAKTSYKKPLSPATLDKAVMEGLGNNSLTWSDEYKASARATIGAGTGTVSSLSDLAVTADASELNVLDGITATTEELNYTDGVTSAIQPQLNSLDTRISNLQNIGRFLSILDAANGTVSSQPTGSVGDTYAYKVGDYYRIGAAGKYTPKNTLTFTIDATSGSSNFEQSANTYSIGDVIYCSNVGESATTWVKQTSSGGGTVQDVTVNGRSIVSGGIAALPKIDINTFGVAALANQSGIQSISGGYLRLSNATEAGLTGRSASSNYGAVTVTNYDSAVKHALTDAAGLTYSSEEQTAALSRLGAENASNKTTTISSSSTDTQYPSAKAVWDTEQDIKEIAEGKTKSYVISLADNPTFNTQTSSFFLTDNFIDINHVSHNPLELKLGDNIYIVETDVPDRWSGEPQSITPVVPTGYTQVMSLESRGVGYIDLGYQVSSGTVEVDCYPLEYGAGSSYQGILGVNGGPQLAWFITNINQCYWHTGSQSAITCLIKPEPYGEVTYKITLHNGKYYINNTDTGIACIGTLNMKLFYAETSAKYAGFKRLRVYDTNNVLIHDYYPCYRNSDDANGVYDIIDDTFTAATGTLIRGGLIGVGVTVYKLETAKVPVTDVKIGNNSIVTNTIATIPNANSTTLGLIRADGTRKFNVSDGYPYCDTITYSDWSSAMSNSFVSKGSLDNVVAGSLVRFDAATSLTDAQKTQARSNVGALGASDITGKEDSFNKVTSITSSSTDTQYPSAAAVYGLVIGAIEGEY